MQTFEPPHQQFCDSSVDLDLRFLEFPSPVIRGGKADRHTISRNWPPPGWEAACTVRPANKFCLLVMLGVVLCRFVCMMRGVQAMAVRHMCMVSSLFVVAGFVMLGSLTMMVCGILVVLGRDLVVVAALVRLRAHVSSPLVRVESPRPRLSLLSDGHMTRSSWR
jgi:hypothetical protein